MVPCARWTTSLHTSSRSDRSRMLNALHSDEDEDEIGGDMRHTIAVEAGARRDPAIAKSATTVPFVNTVLSKDGTAIAFQRIGDGPPVILVDGALCYRGMGQSGQLAELLAPHFTVFTYDDWHRAGAGAVSAGAEPHRGHPRAALQARALLRHRRGCSRPVGDVRPRGRSARAPESRARGPHAFRGARAPVPAAAPEARAGAEVAARAAG